MHMRAARPPSARFTLLRPGVPHHDLGLLAHLTGHHREPVLRAQVQGTDVVIVAMEEELLVVCLVVHNTQGRRVVDQAAIRIVKEVGAAALARGVAVHKRQPQRVAGLQLSHVVGLTRVVGPDVVARSKRHALERVVLERVVEGVVVLHHVAAQAIGIEVAVLDPLRFGRAEALAGEQRRAFACLLRVEALALGQPSVGHGIGEWPTSH